MMMYLGSLFFSISAFIVSSWNITLLNLPVVAGLGHLHQVNNSIE